ncbi:Clp protease N-terminal domain-containing protein [Actinomadura chokoriensis]|uniref:Clp protease N-terminal domain-containing protein n=1 Tax=Actinomadura chokoriensis TaxID=454156 RepID=A0ABV4QUU2_9ACTN
MAPPDLDALVAEAVRACEEAGAGERPDRIGRLAAAAGVAERLRALADDLVDDHVEQCRLHGRSWAEIGTALGVSRQAVEQRYRAAGGRCEPEEFAEEICTAVAHMKEAAVRHRNNVIGTEHVLCGLLAENNSAVRLLSSLDVPADSLRRRVQSSLTVGASQAAKRFAWTPRTRKVLTTAQELAAEDGRPVSCEHLLLGLAALGRGAAAAALAEASAGPSALARARSRRPGEGWADRV